MCFSKVTRIRGYERGVAIQCDRVVKGIEQVVIEILGHLVGEQKILEIRLNGQFERIQILDGVMRSRWL